MGSSTSSSDTVVRTDSIKVGLADDRSIFASWRMYHGGIKYQRGHEIYELAIGTSTMAQIIGVFKSVAWPTSFSVGF